MRIIITSNLQQTPLSLSILNSLSEKPCINLLKLQEQYKPSSNDTKKMPELYGMSKTSDPHQRFNDYNNYL